jgi:hypothetical protein
MASIMQHKSGWRAQIYVMGIRDSAVFDEKFEAETWAKKRESEIKLIRELAGEGNRRKRLILNQADLLSIDDILETSMEIPKTCGIYFLINNNEIVYVGQSINIHQRLQKHLYEKQFDKINIIPCERFELNRMESLYINKFKPKLNVAGINNAGDQYLRESAISKLS